MATHNSSKGETRKSALWGTGSRGGEHRSSALWGRGGRGAVVGTVAAFALLAPIAALAGGGSGRNNGPTPDGKWGKFVGGQKGDGINDNTFVSKGLWKRAKDNGNAKIRVIIQSVDGAAAAETAFGKAENGAPKDGDRLGRRLNLIDGVAVEITARKLARLAQNPNLVITVDAPVQTSGTVNYSSQLWPYESGNAALWPQPWRTSPKLPTIAIVDSGLDATLPDLAGRAYPQVNLDSRNPGATGDDRGHGTFVAGIAAGGAPGHVGAAPTANILPIRVMDGTGMAYTSDVINACAWILANKSTYNIKVANFSLHSATMNHFYLDPLDRAVEKLWFNGVTVVAAAGNYGTGSTPSGVRYAPGNDPFVITVGAADLANTVRVSDDTAAPWSAWGYTEDGFAKPDLAAPGRYMVGPVSHNASLKTEKADHVVAAGYMELSGTSFSAPVVSGTVAAMLGQHPSWTPDQVKAALMLTSKFAPQATRGSLGVGEVNAARAVGYSGYLSNPNRALERFVSVSSTGSVAFAAASWSDLVSANASWVDASWVDASWVDASWNAASWADASWNAASWADASWADASWADASWADSSREDAAEGDAVGTPPTMDAADLAAIQADPSLAIDPAAVPVELSTSLTDTSSSAGSTPPVATPPVVDPVTITMPVGSPGITAPPALP